MLPKGLHKVRYCGLWHPAKRLFLSFSHLSGVEIKEKTRRGTYHDRMVILSDDGETWHPATTEDFASGVARPE